MELRHRETLKHNFYGGALAMSGAGHLVIGTHLTHQEGLQKFSTVFIYTTVGGESPVLLQEITQEPIDPFSLFGAEVAISNNGQFLAVSAPLMAFEGVREVGAVYLYRNDGHDHFSLIQILQPTKVYAGQHYGRSITVSSTGVLVISSAGRDDEGLSGFDIYKYSEGLGYCEFIDNLTGDEGFGRYVSISDEGERIAEGSKDRALACIFKYQPDEKNYNFEIGLGFPTEESDILPGKLKINAAGDRIVMISERFIPSKYKDVRVGTVYERIMGYCSDESLIAGREIYREQWIRKHVLLIDSTLLMSDSVIDFAVSDDMASIVVTTFTTTTKVIYRFQLKDDFYVKADQWSFEPFQSQFVLFGRSIVVNSDGTKVYITNALPATSEKIRSGYGGIEIFDIVD